MQNVLPIKLKAQSLKDKGYFAEAYALYLHLAKNDPGNVDYRLALGELSQALKRPEDALRLYKHLAANLLQQGNVIQAISVNKRILEINAEDLEIQQQLNAICTEVLEIPNPQQSANRQRAVHRVQEMAQSPLVMPGAKVEGEGFDSIFDFASNLEMAEEKNEADLSISGHDNFNEIQSYDPGQADLSLMGMPPPKVEIPQIPLFSDLPPKVLADLVARCKRWSVPPETLLVRQGDPGDALFIISYGRARVLKKVGSEIKVLQELKGGDFYGEFAYFSRRPREATVMSIDAVEVLEITRILMDQILLESPKVEQALQKLYRQRVLDNLLRESTLFSSLGDDDRNRFVSRFCHMQVESGKTIIREGDNADAFYVIQSGSVKVVKGNDPQPLARLGPGEFFGEYAMITGTPRTASIVALEKTDLVLLTREVFRELLTNKPDILEKVREIARKRVVENKARQQKG